MRPALHAGIMVVWCLEGQATAQGLPVNASPRGSGITELEERGPVPWHSGPKKNPVPSASSQQACDR